MIKLKKLLNLDGAKRLYDDLRARIEQRYTKPATGIPASDIASGVIPDPTDLIDDTAGAGDTDLTWSADKLSNLNSQIDALDNGFVKTVNPGDLTKFPCKQNTYINNTGEEVALNGYDTYYIPCAVGSFVHIDWTAHSTYPWSGLNDNYAIKLHDNNGNFYSISVSSSIYGKYSKSKKELLVIPTTVDSTVTITVLRAYAEDTVVSVGDHFAHTNPESNTDIRKTTMAINEKTAVLSIFYINSDQSSVNYNCVGELEDIARTANINVRQGDKIQFTGVKQGLAGLGTFHTIGQTVKINTESTTNLLYTVPSDGILSVFYLYGGDYDAIIIPREQIAISADHVYGLTDAVQQELTEFQGEIDALDDRVDSIESELNASSIQYNSGDTNGYYRVVSGTEDEVELKSSSTFTCQKITIQEWMHSVSFEVLSTSGIASSAIYCGFLDSADKLISRNPIETGKYNLDVPANAASIIINFFGATYNTSYTVKPDSFVRQSAIDALHIENGFDGLSGVAFGTSLTYRAQTTGGYLQYLPDLSGMTFDNQGIGSSYIYGNMLTAIKSYAGYADKQVCLLEGFVNDWYNNKALGTWKDTGETSVCGCVRSALNYMLSQNANLTIFLILDPYGRNYSNVDCSTTAVNGSGLTQFEFYEEIAKVAESLGIPVIKEYAESQISENTPQYLLDNIHPNALGAKQSAQFIWCQMKQYMPNVVS